jgi:UDP-N-acetylglucosamine--N-acetylmuramyl-(pentapeptide) pyrophosphoryl-undecaprenol N-acetylglucosamine transferase
VVFAGGGTGGHVYPSLAVARALEAELRADGEALEALYIGVRGRIDESIVPAEGMTFRAIPAGPLRVSSAGAFLGNVAKLVRGVSESLTILREFRPTVVFATGGYASVPVGVAARLLRRPLVVYLPDVTPGWAVRLLARLATKMTTTNERALAYLPARRTEVVGYPVREGFSTLDRATARTLLGLPAGANVLLVTAGSLGARRINAAVRSALPRLLEDASVLHVTGVDDVVEAEQERAALPPTQRERYRVYGYLAGMPAAMIAADLVICRAGASSLGELPAAGAPAILVPGEYEGWSQAPNAEFMQAQGAAVVLRNAELDRLADTALDLLRDRVRLARMSEAARTLARPNAARDIARILRKVAA